MIVLDKRRYERIVAELIDAKDLRNLVDRYSLDRIYYYHILKDISLGQRSPNYKLLKKIAQRRKLKDDFVIEQAKTILNYFMTYYQSLPADSLDYYKILNVQRNATDEEIRRSWIELMKAHHPDMAGADGLDTSKKINEAYEVLSNSAKREAYDNKHLPPTPVIVPQTDMKKYYYAGAFMVIVFLAVMYASGSGLIFRSPEEKERLAKEFEAPEMPNTVYKGDYLDTDKVDKKISEIKPIEQANENRERADVKEPKSNDIDRVNAPSERVKELKTVAKSEPRDMNSSAGTLEKPQNPGAGIDTKQAADENVAQQKPEMEKKIEITEVTPDEQETKSQPSETAKSEEKAQGNEKLSAKSEPVQPAAPERASEDTPETAKSSDVRDKIAETLPKDKASAEAANEVNEVIEAKQETANESKHAQMEKTEKSSQTAAAEKPATPAERKTVIAEAATAEKEKAPVGEEFYTVRQGDSLWSIAHKFGKTTGELESLNGISGSNLRIGEKILISGTAAAYPKQVTEVAVKKPETKQAPIIEAKKEVPQAPVVAKSAAPVTLPVKTEITKDFNPKLATSAVAIRDAAVQAPEPIPPAASPNKDSVYGFVTDYVSAYKNRDINRVKALFTSDAVENGVSISRALNSYSANFSNIDIMRYDVKVSTISVQNSRGYVQGEFFITFKDQRTGTLKNSKGQINWTLSWTGGTWKIRELTYKIENTDTVG